MVGIMDLRHGVAVPGCRFVMPFAFALVELPLAWIVDMHNLIGQLLEKGVPVIVVSDTVTLKLVPVSKVPVSGGDC